MSHPIVLGTLALKHAAAIAFQRLLPLGHLTRMNLIALGDWAPAAFVVSSVLEHGSVVARAALLCFWNLRFSERSVIPPFTSLFMGYFTLFTSRNLSSFTKLAHFEAAVNDLERSFNTNEVFNFSHLI